MLIRIFELYARHGSSLSNNGLFEAVLPISEIDNILDLFKDSNLIVLGGDLYKEVSPNFFEPIYADWFYNGTNSALSIETAQVYLEQFKMKNVFVSFVLRE